MCHLFCLFVTQLQQELFTLGRASPQLFATNAKYNIFKGLAPDHQTFKGLLKTSVWVSNKNFCKPYFWPKAPNHILAEGPDVILAQGPRRP